MTTDPIHIDLMCWAPARNGTAEDTAATVLNTLAGLGRLDYFAGGFHGSDPSPDDPQSYVEAVVDGAFDLAQGRMSVHPFFGPAETPSIFHLFFRFMRGGTPGVDEVQLQMRRVHPEVPVNTALVRQVIGVLARQFEIGHVSCSPGSYASEFKPVAPERMGIGWCGWVPFALTGDDLPEAGRLVSLGRGTFIALQNEPFEAFGARVDREAVARAQALELRLNALGMLPTRADLASGTWGQSG